VFSVFCVLCFTSLAGHPIVAQKFVSPPREILVATTTATINYLRIIMKGNSVSIGGTYLCLIVVISDVSAFQFSTILAVGKHFLSSRGDDNHKSLRRSQYANIAPHSESSSITFLEDEQDNWIANAAETLPNELSFPHRYNEDTTTAEPGEVKGSDSDITIYGSKDELMNDQIEGEIRDMTTKTTAVGENLSSDLHNLDHYIVSSGFFDSFQNRELLERDEMDVKLEHNFPKDVEVQNTDLISADLTNTMSGPRKMIQQSDVKLSRNGDQHAQIEACNSLPSTEKYIGKSSGNVDDDDGQKIYYVHNIPRLRVPVSEHKTMSPRLEACSNSEGRIEQPDSCSAINETRALDSNLNGSVEKVKDVNVIQKNNVEPVYQLATEPTSPLPPFHFPDLLKISYFLKATLTPSISFDTLKQKGDGALIECAAASATKSIIHTGKMAALASETLLDIITDCHVLYETRHTVSTVLECIKKEEDILKSIQAALSSTLTIANTILRTAVAANTTKCALVAAEEIGQGLTTTFVALSMFGGRKFRTIVDYTLKLTEQQLANYRENSAFEAAVTEADKQCENENKELSKNIKQH
jgi:hypothetical protein